MKNRGFTGIEVIVVLAIIAAATWVLKPSLLPGASRRAAQSTTATAAVEKATTAQGAEVAAGLTQIATANAAAPASPARDYVSREVPFLLSMLPAPSGAALLAAEKRRVAVMEGQLDEARRLYETATRHAQTLQNERDEALRARHAADIAIEQAAAAEHARTLQFMGAAAIALLLLAAWAYAKFCGISPATAGAIAADVAGGLSLTAALDTHLPPRLHPLVNRARRLATPTTP